MIVYNKESCCLQCGVGFISISVNILQFKALKNGSQQHPPTLSRSLVALYFYTFEKQVVPRAAADVRSSSAQTTPAGNDLVSRGRALTHAVAPLVDWDQHKNGCEKSA